MEKKTRAQRGQRETCRGTCGFFPEAKKQKGGWRAPTASDEAGAAVLDSLREARVCSAMILEGWPRPDERSIVPWRSNPNGHGACRSNARLCQRSERFSIGQADIVISDHASVKAIIEGLLVDHSMHLRTHESFISTSRAPANFGHSNLQGSAKSIDEEVSSTQC